MCAGFDHSSRELEARTAHRASLALADAAATASAAAAAAAPEGATAAASSGAATHDEL